MEDILAMAPFMKFFERIPDAEGRPFSRINTHEGEITIRFTIPPDEYALFAQFAYPELRARRQIAEKPQEPEKETTRNFIPFPPQKHCSGGCYE